MPIPDNYDAFCRHDAAQAAELDKLPVCCECGEHIQAETLFEINDEIICEECMECYRKPTEDVVR